MCIGLMLLGNIRSKLVLMEKFGRKKSNGKKVQEVGYLIGGIKSSGGGNGGIDHMPKIYLLMSQYLQMDLEF